MRSITTPGFVLEPLVAAHAHEMFAVLSDPAIYEFENAPPPSAPWLLERYRRLEQRGPADGSEIWLNWVIRLPTGALAGYVQASVLPGGQALLGYELNSRHWRQGIGAAAVASMLDELAGAYGVQQGLAVLKAANFRSLGLLCKLGFAPADEALGRQYRDEADELVLSRRLAQLPPGSPGPAGGAAPLDAAATADNAAIQQPSRSDSP